MGHCEITNFIVKLRNKYGIPADECKLIEELDGKRAIWTEQGYEKGTAILG